MRRQALPKGGDDAVGSHLLRLRIQARMLGDRGIGQVAYFYVRHVAYLLTLRLELSQLSLPLFSDLPRVGILGSSSRSLPNRQPEADPDVGIERGSERRSGDGKSPDPYKSSR